jgi:glycosyltransferase involved in cell wall biosynthesis
MSDVMPYRSTVWSTMTDEMLDTYVAAWTKHLTPILEQYAPDLIHVHHLWLLASILRDIAPNIPIVNHCHATGLRQMKLCPDRAPAIRENLLRNDHFVVLHSEHAEALEHDLAIPAERIRVVGAGYREAVFHHRERTLMHRSPVYCYAGKYSAAKGLPWLLDAFNAVREVEPEAVLHIAGTGAGEEADALRERMTRAPGVILHGMLSPEDLAELMRTSSVFVLPSMYEGLPLVLVEAAACGCRLVSTRLPGVEALATQLGPILDTVTPPRLRDVDHPVEEDLPRFVDDLAEKLLGALDRTAPDDPSPHVEPFTWNAVFERIEAVWKDLTSPRP